MPRSSAERRNASWLRFAQMTNQKRRSVLRRGAAGGLIRGQSRLVPFSSGVERAVPRFSANEVCNHAVINFAKRSLLWRQPNRPRSVSTEAHKTSHCISADAITFRSHGGVI